MSSSDFSQQTSRSTERRLARVPIVQVDGTPVRLYRHTPPLMRKTIREFCSRWIPGGTLIYAKGLSPDGVPNPPVIRFGLRSKSGSKLPDIVVSTKGGDLLFLVDMGENIGLITARRRMELASMFGGIGMKLMFITVFESRRSISKYLEEFSWGTTVWAADAPDHLIHFDGAGLAGPY